MEKEKKKADKQIKHLLHKRKKKKLTLDFFPSPDRVCCRITLDVLTAPTKIKKPFEIHDMIVHNPGR